MKKIPPLLFLGLFVWPQLVFAAWWNPFSWFNGWTFLKGHESAKEESVQGDKTQELEDRIKELEQKLDETTTSTEVESIVVNVENEEKEIITPVVEKVKTNSMVSVPTQVTPTAPSVDYDTLYRDIDGKYFSFRENIKIEIEALDEYNKLTSNQSKHRAFLLDLEKKLNDGVGSLSKLFNVEPKPASVVDDFVSKYSKIQEDYLAEKIRYDKGKVFEAKDNFLDFIDQNRSYLCDAGMHAEVSRQFDILDYFFNTHYSDNFQLTDTCQKTTEYINSFLLDIEVGKWSTPVNY